ncbi:unnamed protein product [Arctia plantaginis]|nr:unnamed protein product [Arctia plantaginis]
MPNQQLEATVPVRELLGESFLENLRCTRVQVTETRAYRRRRRINVPPGKSITAADVVEEETTGRDIILSSLLSDSDQSSEFVMEASGTSRNIENVDSNQETEIVAPTISPSSTKRERNSAAYAYQKKELITFEES